MSTRVRRYGSVKILKWGHGLGLRIPLRLAQRVGLEEGSVVEISHQEASILVEPLPKAPTLERLLAEVDAKNVPAESGWRRRPVEADRESQG